MPLFPDRHYQPPRYGIVFHRWILCFTVFGILLVYACISIGSLVSNHKILTAVLSFIGLSTAIQTFGGIGVVQVFQTSTSPAAVTTSSVSTLVITVLLCVVLFLICRYILSRRLNLS